MLEWGRKQGGLVSILLDGQQVAQVDPQFWGEGGHLTIGDQAWEFGRDGWDRVARVPGTGQVVLRGSKKSLMSSSWLVSGDGADYEIGKQGFFGSTHVVHRDGQQVGSGRTAGFWSSRPVLDLDPSVPPLHQLFLLWLSHLIRRRDAAAASSSS